MMVNYAGRFEEIAGCLIANVTSIMYVIKGNAFSALLNSENCFYYYSHYANYLLLFRLLLFVCDGWMENIPEIGSHIVFLSLVSSTFPYIHTFWGK